MKKQSSIEWLEKQIGSKIADANIRISAPNFYELINQAKEMHKQEIIDTWENAFSHGAGVNEEPDIYHGTQYYKNTYEKTR